MFDFLKEQKKKPFSYLSIEMRKGSKGYLWWIVWLGAIVLLSIIFWIK